MTTQLTKIFEARVIKELKAINDYRSQRAIRWLKDPDAQLELRELIEQGAGTQCAADIMMDFADIRPGV